MSRPLLFLGHAADRTGPPIYLLRFLRWLRANHPNVDIEVALLAGGELEQDFMDLAPTSIYRGLPPSPWEAAHRRILLTRLDLEDQWWSARRSQQIRHQMRQHSHCGVVYINGAPCAEMARLMPEGDRSLLSHVHELEVGLTHLCSARDRAVLLDQADRVFSVADAVTDNLIRTHGVDPSLIRLHRGMVDLTELPPELDPSARGAARRALGLPPDGLIVGSAGTLDWRKAPDLFLRMAWEIDRRHTTGPVTFVWLGGHPEGVTQAQDLASAMGVDHLVRFVGVQSDPINWFAVMDVFVLPAREDPFPLVCLEAAAVGCPVVAFDNGGIPELLIQGCGLVATYPDVGELADKVASLLEHPLLRRSTGERGQEIMRVEHDISILAPRLWSDIEVFL